MKTRPYTAEEIRAQVMSHVVTMVDYWATLPSLSVKDRCEGVAFSIMTMLDGATALPRFTVAVQSSDEDRAFHESEGENYYPDGTAINDDTELHEAFAALLNNQRQG